MVSKLVLIAMSVAALMLVIVAAMAARVMYGIYAVRRQDRDAVNRWENEGGAVLDERECLPY